MWISCLALLALASPQDEPARISGRYPHLTMFNHQGECGIGAVAPWAGRLWVITYAPHKPQGSDDKLYAIDEQLRMEVRPESVGGTPAGRMIHAETRQLLIGPYLIDERGQVRVIPPARMPGRLTAIARHLEEPERKVYYYDMEGALYEVDVLTLEVTRLFEKPIPGWHGKGACTAQGRLVIANNGERGPAAADSEDAGALAEWDGETWTIVARRQFTEVSSLGSIRGARDEDAPLSSLGWDRRSVIWKRLVNGEWQSWRLPRGCFSYDGRHGWHTEWPRIRAVDSERRLMYMHGLLYELIGERGAPRPLGVHLKIFADLCAWRGELVFACDDVSRFDNPFANQSQSNLWFASRAQLEELGSPAGWGGPWLGDDLDAGAISDPFLIGGFAHRCLHLAHESPHPVRFALEVLGEDGWQDHGALELPARGHGYRVLSPRLAASWMRLRVERECRGATAHFLLGSGGRREDLALFAGLARGEPRSAGIVRPRGGDLGTLQLLAGGRYYEMDADLELRHRPEEAAAREYLERTAGAGALDYEVDRASVILRDTDGRAYRLPKGPAPDDGPPRGIREVVTERSLLHCQGSFYVLPRANSGGVRAIKPVATSAARIADFCTWRGLLVLSGCRADAAPDGHLVRSDDGRAGLWLGDLDDLWKLGHPRGIGGPWAASAVRAGEPSDPYLMRGYDRKRLHLHVDGTRPVTFRLEVDIANDGRWREIERFVVLPRAPRIHRFPEGFSAHWVRLRAERDCTATATFHYE